VRDHCHGAEAAQMSQLLWCSSVSELHCWNTLFS